MLVAKGLAVRVLVALWQWILNASHVNVSTLPPRRRQTDGFLGDAEAGI